MGSSKGKKPVKPSPPGVPRFSDWREAASWIRERLTASQKKWLRKNLMHPQEELDSVDLDAVETDYVRQRFLKMEKDKESGEEVPTVNDSQLLRSLIWQFWLKLLARQADPVGGNVRSFWYRPVSGFYRRHHLDRTDRPTQARPRRDLGDLLLAWSGAADLWLAVGQADGRGSTGSKRKDYLIDEMGDCLGEFAVRRFFDLVELGFRPDKRPYKLGTGKASIIVFTEKDGLRELVEEVHRTEKVTGYAASGEPSLLLIEDLVARLKAKGIRQVDVGGFCDHDPFGYNMLESLDEKFRVYGMEPEVYLLTTQDQFDREIGTQRRWVLEAAELLAEIGGGFTILPPVEGGWMNQTGQIIWEHPVLLYTFVKPDAFLDCLPRLRRFLHRLGRQTHQGEVAFEFDSRFYRITKFESGEE